MIINIHIIIIVDIHININTNASAIQASSPRASTSLSPRASAAARDLWDDVEESEVARPRAILFFPGAYTGKLLRGIAILDVSPYPSPEHPRSFGGGAFGPRGSPSGDGPCGGGGPNGGGGVAEARAEGAGGGAGDTG